MNPVESMNAAVQHKKDPTPREMLKFYREGSDPITLEQIKLFNLLPVSERIELMLFIQFHLTHLTQQLHAHTMAPKANAKESLK